MSRSALSICISYCYCKSLSLSLSLSLSRRGLDVKKTLCLLHYPRKIKFILSLSFRPDTTVTVDSTGRKPPSYLLTPPRLSLKASTLIVLRTSGEIFLRQTADFFPFFSPSDSALEVVAAVRSTEKSGISAVHNNKICNDKEMRQKENRPGRKTD